MDFERARTTEQIEHRKNEIIKACARLYDEGGYDHVTIKAIGEITSFTRSSTYNYYKTKEEILLDVLLNDLKQWAGDINIMVEAHNSLSKEEYCKKMTDIYLNNDRMLRLFSILFSSLEKNSSVEKLASFKSGLKSVMTPYSLSLNKFFPNSPEEEKTTFILNLSSFIIGLYPTCNITDKQKEAIKLSNYPYSHPNFKEMCYKGMMLLIAEL